MYTACWKNIFGAWLAILKKQDTYKAGYFEIFGKVSGIFWSEFVLLFLILPFSLSFFFFSLF